LREGEQFANAFFDTAKKIEIAKALDDSLTYLSLQAELANGLAIRTRLLRSTGTSELDLSDYYR
jgi:hypothetical protein